MKPFDLDAAKRGAAVCTKDGRGVVPVTVDHLLQGPYVFSGIVDFGDELPDKRVVETWTEYGLLESRDIGECSCDLMMRDDDYAEKLARGEYHIEDKLEMIDSTVKENLTVENPTCKESLPVDREYWRRVYAGQAMQGILASDINIDLPPADAARFAVCYTDALIEELEKTGADCSKGSQLSGGITK